MVLFKFWINQQFFFIHIISVQIVHKVFKVSTVFVEYIYVKYIHKSLLKTKWFP